MAITKFKETRRSRAKTTSKDAQTARREYMLWYGSWDEAEDYVNSHAPATIVGAGGKLLLPDSLDLQPADARETVWTAVVDYTTAPKKERSEVGDETISFDLASQTAKVSQSLSTVNSYAVTGTAPDFQGGIGYDQKKREFEGVDRMVEQFSFSITKILANESITNSYIQSLRGAAFSSNSATFRGLAAGEVLFVGASGSPRDAETYTITYKFQVSRNVTGLSVGDVGGISKQGWDYLWVLRSVSEDSTAKLLTPRPLAAYVERLYASSDFTSSLGLSA
jgi:hypothetical protein